MISQHTEEELQAREALMRLQFRRDEDAWNEATPAEIVLEKLKARLNAEL